MGSGSTGEACMKTNRKFIGIELDDKYFDFYKRQEEARASILDLVIDALKDQDDLRQENLENTQDDIEEQIEFSRRRPQLLRHLS